MSLIRTIKEGSGGLVTNTWLDVPQCLRSIGQCDAGSGRPTHRKEICAVRVFHLAQLILSKTAAGLIMNTSPWATAAVILKIHPVTLQRKSARRRDNTRCKIGKCWVFAEIDLDRYHPVTIPGGERCRGA